MAGSIHKFLTQKTFGISNWILGVGVLGGLYLVSQGFPSVGNISFSTKGCPPGRCTLDHMKPCGGTTSPSGGCEE